MRRRCCVKLCFGVSPSNGMMGLSKRFWLLFAMVLLVREAEGHGEWTRKLDPHYHDVVASTSMDEDEKATDLHHSDMEDSISSGSSMQSSSIFSQQGMESDVDDLESMWESNNEMHSSEVETDRDSESHTESAHQSTWSPYTGAWVHKASVQFAPKHGYRAPSSEMSMYFPSKKHHPAHRVPSQPHRHHHSGKDDARKSHSHGGHWYSKDKHTGMPSGHHWPGHSHMQGSDVTTTHHHSGRHDATKRHSHGGHWYSKDKHAGMSSGHQQSGHSHMQGSAGTSTHHHSGRHDATKRHSHGGHWYSKDEHAGMLSGHHLPGHSHMQGSDVTSTHHHSGRDDSTKSHSHGGHWYSKDEHTGMSSSHHWPGHSHMHVTKDHAHVSHARKAA